MTIPCKQCLQDFEPWHGHQQICSGECKILWNQGRTQRLRKTTFLAGEERTCAVCTHTFAAKYYNSTTCSKNCLKEQKRLIQAEYVIKNRDKINQRARENFIPDKSERLGTKTEIKNQRQERAEMRIKAPEHGVSGDRVIRHAYNYNITLDQSLELLKIETCEICGDTEEKIVTDHCHETLKVRGRLCTGCNMAIGRFKDSIEILNNAIKYLEKGFYFDN